MVPHEERERLENLFKGESEAVNAFVCTPTLELGVDIGMLDAVLMRNVPPLPANYWQRAGRAGRRHRMAVDLTYCRPVSHDRAYFADPLKMLAGRVDPPAFNLRNDLMVAKHVHATVITRLHQYTRNPARSEKDRKEIEGTLKACLPDRISAYLFDDGLVRERPFDLSPLGVLIDSNKEDLLGYVERAFHQGWPLADEAVTHPEALRSHVDGMVGDLNEVIARLSRRLHWALEQIKRLNALREKQGDLDPEDEVLFRRCDGLVKKLKGTARRTRREAEGYDDVNTYSVLAAEGFLPGYGLDTGSVLGTAEIPFWRTGAMEFALPRPPSMALREYVPGNLIYANGNRFVARRFHRDIDEQRAEMPIFEISTERQAVKETKLGAPATTLGATTLQTIAVCDVDLVHQSHISDEEELRFQMGVSVYGLERDQHNGGKVYKWGNQSVHHRRGVRLRLVNVGTTSAITRFQRFGYPICTVCGQSISPLSSDRQREQFEQSHRERCGRVISSVGFYADVVADVLSLPACPDQTTAYSVLEALRFAATRVLDMHMEDLQVLVIGYVDREEVDGLLWDPMPGGSGLLDQLAERFGEIVEIALGVVKDCPSACETSCIDCLQTFRNGYYHKHLNRKLAQERVKAWGSHLTFAHEIPPKQPSKEPAEWRRPVNEPERRLRYLLLAAGFEEGIRGRQIRLDRAIGTTTPDVLYCGPHHSDDEGVCIYLDGLSGHLHGNPATSEQDQRIRTWLRNNGYEVIEIAVSELHDPDAMTRHFRRLAGYLRADAIRERLQNDTEWFSKAGEEAARKGRYMLRLVRPNPKERYVKCVPFVPLKVAAGAFSEPQHLTSGEWDWEWVEVDTHRRLRPGMFVLQVQGKSMEPAIPDGSYCLFSAPVAGPKGGRTVIVLLLDKADPETGERYTIKRYSSEKTPSDDGDWRHITITLKPNNPDFKPIELTCEDESSVAVVAELLEVLS
jgi:SOS-response transcriptional repressor LexA